MIHITPLTGVLLASPAAGFITGAASNDSGGLDWGTILGSTVTPVLVVVLLITGKLNTEGQLKDANADKDDWKQQAITERNHSDQLQKEMNNDIIPALTRAAVSLDRVAPILQWVVSIIQTGVAPNLQQQHNQQQQGFVPPQPPTQGPPGAAGSPGAPG